MSWPRELRHPLAMACAVAYSLLYFSRHWGHWPLPAFITSYLADVLALPLVLSLAVSTMRRLYFRKPAFTLPLSWVIAAWGALTLWFELLLPRLQPGTATADLLDALAYALGGAVFWCCLNQPARQ